MAAERRPARGLEPRARALPAEDHALALGEPLAQALVHLRVVEQGEVAALDPEGLLVTPRRGARAEHEQVTRRRHEAMPRAVEQRDLLTRNGAQSVRVAVTPVVVHQRAAAQVADAAAAPAQEARHAARLRQ